MIYSFLLFRDFDNYRSALPRQPIVQRFQQLNATEDTDIDATVFDLCVKEFFSLVSSQSDDFRIQDVIDGDLQRHNTVHSEACATISRVSREILAIVKQERRGVCELHDFRLSVVWVRDFIVPKFSHFRKRFRQIYSMPYF
jgi:hypothetical protein